VNKTEALRVTLDTLTSYRTVIKKYGYAFEKGDAAIAAIKEALAQPEQKPVGQLCEEAYGRGQVMWFNKPEDGSKLYTAPPKREWVGLTDEQIQKIWDVASGAIPNWSRHIAYARAIEAAHGIKAAA
jgi:hypothetical protein